MIEHLDLLMFAFACIILILGYPVAFSLAGSAILFAYLGDYFNVFPHAVYEGNSSENFRNHD
jgi:TRAP-type mannitol/chloroaromatic compound transport system permease large subunit